MALPLPHHQPYRVCFVCTGNICRSPTAEVVLRAQVAAAGLTGRVEVDSAGLGDWHVGQDADTRTRKTFEAAGYELTHQARQFDRAWFAERDLIVALDGGHLRSLVTSAPDETSREKVVLLRSFDPSAAADPHGLDVPDPYDGGGEGFTIVLAQVERACAGLLADLVDRGLVAP